MSVCAETPRSSFERLAMRACAVCLLLILSLAVHAGATGIRAASGDTSRIGLAFAPDSPVADIHHAASGAVDPATDQPLILQSGAGDGEEDEHPARRPSIPFCGPSGAGAGQPPGDPPESAPQGFPGPRAARLPLIVIPAADRRGRRAGNACESPGPCTGSSASCQPSQQFGRPAGRRNRNAIHVSRAHVSGIHVSGIHVSAADAPKASAREFLARHRFPGRRQRDHPRGHRSDRHGRSHRLGTGRACSISGPC